MSAAEEKLGRLARRLVAAESGALTERGRDFMLEVLRWRFRLRPTKPQLSQRGRALDVVRYERQVIEARVSRALTQREVLDEVEAVGAQVRPGRGEISPSRAL